jgi:hypothetical protein
MNVFKSDVKLTSTPVKKAIMTKWSHEFLFEGETKPVNDGSVPLVLPPMKLARMESENQENEDLDLLIDSIEAAGGASDNSFEYDASINEFLIVEDEDVIVSLNSKKLSTPAQLHNLFRCRLTRSILSPCQLNHH